MSSDATIPPPAPARRAAKRALLARLREETEPLVDEEVATGDIDQDAAWAKEIIAATAGMRR